MEKKIKLIIIILFLLFMSGCIGMMAWGIKGNTYYPLRLESIQFQLKGMEFCPETARYLNYPRVFAVNIKGKNMAHIIDPAYLSSFRLSSFCFYTKNSFGNYYDLDDQISGMYYDPKSGKLFGVNYIHNQFPMKRTEQRFVVGKGEIINGQFKACFLKGVEFILVRVPSVYGNDVNYYIKMHLPYRYKDLEFLDLSTPK